MFVWMFHGWGLVGMGAGGGGGMPRAAHGPADYLSSGVNRRCVPIMV